MLMLMLKDALLVMTFCFLFELAVMWIVLSRYFYIGDGSACHGSYGHALVWIHLQITLVMVLLFQKWVCLTWLCSEQEIVGPLHC